MLNRAWKALVVFTLIFNLCVFTTATTPDNAAKPAKKERAVEFALKDQFGNELAYKFPREKVSVLAIGDKEGSEQLEAWIRPLVERYGDKVDIHGIAELSAVPGIAKGVVRNIIKKKSKYAVMLDWSGDVSKSYNFQKDKANIILIDKNGSIVAKQIGTADGSKLEHFYKEIDSLLK